MAYHCDQPQISGLQTLDNLAGSDGRHNAGTTLLHLSRIRRCSPVADDDKNPGGFQWQMVQMVQWDHLPKEWWKYMKMQLFESRRLII